MGKIAIKRLTASDLTLFKWHFTNRNSGNQKSINLNRDVLIDQLYPALPYTDEGRAGLLALDLHLFGPGLGKAWNLQRKIIKGESYKNWRLNGEFIDNPDESPDRFNVLRPGDFVIFDFEGELLPTSARAVFVAAGSHEDAQLHAGIIDWGVTSMRAIDLAQLTLLVHASGTPEIHPVHELLLDAALEDAAQGGLKGTHRLMTQRTGRRLTRMELARARQRAEQIGYLGEELIDAHLSILVRNGTVDGYEWVSAINAISPFDFRLLAPIPTKIEVKATNGDFSQVLHISIAELIEMRDSAEPYHLYRIYGLDEQKGLLRVADNLKVFAEEILTTLSGLPTEITVDSISIKPDVLQFGQEISIDVPAVQDAEEE